MKAAVVRSPRDVVYEDVPDPMPDKGEVLVKVAFCGICGSDIPRVLQGTAHSYPIILGHEFSGAVVAAGDEADESLVGARVAGIPLVPCRQCASCKTGNFSLCENYSFIGSRRPGALAQYVAIPGENVMRLPDEVTLQEGALFEPASVARHAIDVAGFRPGASAVIVGCGTIGILLAQMLIGMGASRVVGLVRRENRALIAEAAGVPEVVDTSRDGWKDKMLVSYVGKGFDFIFDTSGNVKAMVESFALAADRGTVCMVGTPKKDMVFSVPQWERLNRQELTVRGSWMSYSAPFPGGEWVDVARLFADGTLRLVPQMIDGVYDLEHIDEAFKRYEHTGRVSGKILCKCDAAVKRT